MKSFIKALPLLISLSSLSAAQQADAQSAAQLPAARQNMAALGPLVKNFLLLQAAGLPGKISVEPGEIDARLSLAACPGAEAFLPKGNRPWGKTTVGIRCTAPTPWVVYMQATVRVQGDYYIASAPLAQGHVITIDDLSKTSGELSTLPDSIVTDPNQVVGKVVRIPLRLGAALRQDGLRSQNVVQQGQTVKVVSTGPGFQITTEAQSMNNAGEGQVVQAKTAAGQIVSGIAKAGGIVEINY